MTNKLTPLVLILIIAAITATSCKKQENTSREVDQEQPDQTSEPVLYVGLNGVDQGRSNAVASNENTPLRTIQEAANRATAGTTVIILDGTYHLTSPISVLNSGTSTQRIVFKAKNKHKAIITGANTAGTVVTPANNSSGGRVVSGLFNIINRNWITIDGLKIEKSQRFGIFVQASNNITVQNCFTEETYASGIIAVRNRDTKVISTNIKILDNEIKRACVDPTTAGVNECLTLAGVNGFEVAFNKVHDRIYAPGTETAFGGEGIDIKQNCSNGTVHDNTVHDITEIAIYVDAYAERLENVEVYNNRVYNTNSGIVTAVEGESALGGTGVGSLHNIKIYNNLVYDIRGPGIRTAGYLDDGPQTNISIYQNTVVRCGLTSPFNFEGTGLLLEADHPSSASIVVRNNIFADNKVQVIKHSPLQNSIVTLERNLIVGNNTRPTSGLPASSFTDAGTNAIIAASAGFVSATNFNLTSGSPAKDMATGESFIAAKDILGVVRPQGVAADLGAFEYKAP